MEGNPLEYGLPYEDIYIPTRDKVHLNAWFVKQRKFELCPTLIFFHGNAGNIGDRLQNAYGLYENVQCNILMVDYRGYGKSDSVTPDEAGLINDAVACVDYLWKRGEKGEKHKIDRDQIFVFGRSLGGAVSIGLMSALKQLGTQDRIRGVILENTFTSVADMTGSLWAPLRHIKQLFSSQWNSIGRIDDCKSPLLFVSGLADELVPHTMMQQLFENCDPEFKHMVRFPYGTHNETWCEGNYYQHIMLFIKKIYLKGKSSRQHSWFRNGVQKTSANSGAPAESTKSPAPDVVASSIPVANPAANTTEVIDDDNLQKAPTKR